MVARARVCDYPVTVWWEGRQVLDVDRLARGGTVLRNVVDDHFLKEGPLPGTGSNGRRKERPPWNERSDRKDSTDGEQSLHEAAPSAALRSASTSRDRCGNWSRPQRRGRGPCGDHRRGCRRGRPCVRSWGCLLLLLFRRVLLGGWFCRAPLRQLISASGAAKAVFNLRISESRNQSQTLIGHIRRAPKETLEQPKHDSRRPGCFDPDHRSSRVHWLLPVRGCARVRHHIDDNDTHSGELHAGDLRPRDDGRGRVFRRDRI